MRACSMLLRKQNVNADASLRMRAHREADKEDEGLAELLERVAGAEAKHQAHARLRKKWCACGCAEHNIT
jgi:hypothetical protein